MVPFLKVERREGVLIILDGREEKKRLLLLTVDGKKRDSSFIREGREYVIFLY